MRTNTIHLHVCQTVSNHRRTQSCSLEITAIKHNRGTDGVFDRSDIKLPPTLTIKHFICKHVLNTSFIWHRKHIRTQQIVQVKDYIQGCDIVAHFISSLSRSHRWFSLYSPLELSHSVQCPSPAARYHIPAGLIQTSVLRSGQNWDRKCLTVLFHIIKRRKNIYVYCDLAPPLRCKIGGIMY